MEQRVSPQLTLEQTLAPLVEEYQMLSALVSSTEKRKKELSADIKKALTAHGYKLGDDDLDIAGTPVGFSPNSRTELSVEKLLELGVAPSVIKEATLKRDFDPKLKVGK